MFKSNPRLLKNCLIMFSVIMLAIFSAIYVFPPERKQIYTSVPQFFKDYQSWKPLITTLTNSSHSDIHVTWSGYGGDGVLMGTVIEAIRQAQAHGNRVIIHSNSVAYSAHAFVLCYVDKVIGGPGFTATFHPARLNGQLVTNTAFVVYQTALLDQCVKSHWLTEEQAQSIVEGKKVTVTSTGQAITEEDR